MLVTRKKPSRGGREHLAGVQNFLYHHKKKSKIKQCLHCSLVQNNTCEEHRQEDREFRVILSYIRRSCLTRERSLKRQEKAEWEEGHEEKREEKMKSRFGASGNGVALSLFSKPAPQPESKK